MLAVEEVCLGRADEELAAVRVGARVGHRQRAGRAWLGLGLGLGLGLRSGLGSG